MKNNKTNIIKKIILIIYSITPILLLIFDLLNIKRVINISSNYDWLSFIGTYLSGLAVLIISLITVKQNDRLAEINQKTIESSIITQKHHKVLFDEQQEIINEIFRIKLLETNDIPLRSIKINSIIFQKKDENDTYIGEKNILVENDVEYELEYTDNVAGSFESSFYLANIVVNFPFDDIKINDYCKFIIKMSVKNIFNVTIDYNYSVMLKCFKKDKNYLRLSRFHTFENILSIKYENSNIK